jgi:photosystem II stability/assembly factor-like uncharacterized protein
MEMGQYGFPGESMRNDLTVMCRTLVLGFFLLPMSCSSAGSSKPELSLPQDSKGTEIPGLQRIGSVPQGKPPQEILCVDTHRCWLQQGRSLLRSLNGGESWSLVSVIHEDEPLRRFAFYSDEAGWAISLSELYQTEDGGQSWVKKSSPFEQGGEIRSVYFLERTGTVWLAGGLHRPQTKEELKYGVPNNARFGESVIEEAIFRTDDEGKTWQRESLSPELIGRILDVRFFDANHGIALGEKVFYTTIDGGQTWKMPQFPFGCVRKEYLADTYEGQPVSVAMLDSELWWVTYNDGRIVKTEDGGRSWCDLVQAGTVRFDETGLPYFRFLHFFDKQRGWALGGDKYLYETKDSGVTWTRTTSSIRFDSGSFPDRSHGLFVSSAGVFRTTSGG